MPLLLHLRPGCLQEALLPPPGAHGQDPLAPLSPSDAAAAGQGVGRARAHGQVHEGTCRRSPYVESTVRAAPSLFTCFSLAPRFNVSKLPAHVSDYTVLVVMACQAGHYDEVVREYERVKALPVGGGMHLLIRVQEQVGRNGL